MAWTKVPLPRLNYPTLDQAGLPSQLGEKLVDAYIEPLPTGDILIRKRPGFTEFADIGTASGIDGLYWWDAKSKVIACAGGEVHAITDNTGTTADITGTGLATGTPVTFTTDGSVVVMANQNNMVYYDNTNPTANIADADAPTTVTHVDYLDTYILANDTSNLGRWYHSDVTDYSAWGASSFFNASSKPDALQALLVGNREITLFGKESVEFWFNDGSTPFRRKDFVLERGCIAKNSVVNCAGTWMWVDDRKRVIAMDVGTRVPRIVSQAVESEIRDLGSITDAQAMFIPIGNRAFYVLSFPTANRTLVYDLSTNGWAEWGNWQSGTSSYDRYLARSYTYAAGWDKFLVGSRKNGKIYEMSFGDYDDDGEEIRVLMRTGNIDHGTNVKKRSNKLRLRLKRGVGSIGAASDPKIMVRWRDDNNEWSMETGLEVNLGEAGDYDYYATLSRCGQYRTRQWEFSFTHDADFMIVDLEEDVELMTR